MDLEQKFWSYISVAVSGCWEWQGTLNKTGYGQIYSGTFVHRWSYEYFIGSIPVGFVIDHLCRNKRCANPLHLEAVIQHENVLRGTGLTASNILKTHCRQGHEFTPDNTLRRKVDTRVHRACRQCQLESWRRYYYRRLKVVGRGRVA